MQQADAGAEVEEICRNMGISETTFCRWEKKFAPMGLSEMRRFMQREKENIMPNRGGDLSLDKAIL
ncbi:MAG: transposase [Candidatus Latescibacteria bacterium]|nr:transposase [Candidatus Latescibacterota bacterium]